MVYCSSKISICKRTFSIGVGIDGMKEYISQLHQYCNHYSVTAMSRIAPGLSMDEVIMFMRESNRAAFETQLQIKQLLQNNVYPLLEAYENMTQADAQDLYDVAQRLCSYTERLDPGLALQIYQALLSRARSHGDSGNVLKYLYWCGITAYYFDSSNHETILPFFLEGASFADCYDTLPDAQIRQYVHRCLGNCSMVYHAIDQHDKAFEMEEKAFAFWNGLIFKGKDADFPWGMYFLSVFNHRRAYLGRQMHSDPRSLSRAEIRMNLDIAMHINKLRQENVGAASAFGGTRYDVALWESQLVAGQINYDQFMENILESKSHYAPDDFSADALYANIQLNAYLLFYAHHLLPHDAKTQALMDKLINETHAYLASIPMTADPMSVASNMSMYAKNASEILISTGYLQLVLKTTTYRHIPTYAHSIMVSKIACALTTAILRTHPEAFIGMLDIKSAADALKSKEALLAFAETAGLCHDIGKLEYVCKPSFFMRTLTKSEIAIMQNHPHDAYTLLMHANHDRSLSGFSDVVLGHHCYYNGQGGYPSNFDVLASPYKPMIDVISVADSIDAATDDIGKTYAKAITFEAVCEEIWSQEGIRYSPLIAALLKEDRALCAQIHDLLGNPRKEAYYQAYCYSLNL